MPDENENGGTDGGNNGGTDGGTPDGNGGGETPPTTRTCGTMQNYELLVMADPGYADRLAALETTTNEYIALHQADTACSCALAKSGISGERPRDSTAIAFTCLPMISGAAAPRLPHR